MKFMLDTNICIYALKHHPAVTARMLAEARADVSISAISEGELRLGAAKSAAAARTASLIENFLRPLTVVDFTSDDAQTYADIRARLERAGKPIGPLDTLIAAQAVARGLTLVSNNEREFRRVPGLKLVNWAS